MYAFPLVQFWGTSLPSIFTSSPWSMLVIFVIFPDTWPAPMVAWVLSERDVKSNPVDRVRSLIDFMSAPFLWLRVVNFDESISVLAHQKTIV